jgi:acetyl esterase/lipase
MKRLLPVTLMLTPIIAAAGPGGSDPHPEKKTYVYKTAGRVPVQADVYRPPDDRARPAVVWIHGGALIFGSRGGIPKQLTELCRTEGYVLVSVDYRLAPEVLLPEIAADVRDALRWVRRKGPALFRADPRKLVVAGGSAGGYLTMLSGCEVDPPPSALVAYWGYGDVDGAWYSKPSPFYRESVPLVSREDAWKAVGDGVLTGVKGGDRSAGRVRFYHYLRQNGLWTKVVTGMTPGDSGLDRYCPVRRITPRYPPILMVHGTEDTDVPYDRSAEMAAALARRGVAHELVTVPGAGHGLAGGDPALVAAAHARALDFIRRHLK